MTTLYETHRLTHRELRNKKCLEPLKDYMLEVIASEDYDGLNEPIIIKIHVILSEIFPGIQVCAFKERNNLIIDFIFREPEQKTLFYLLYN